MGKFKMDMRGENDPGMQFPEGWHGYAVEHCTESMSKKGNDMFIITLALLENRAITGDVYAIATPGKRWFLKQFLAACEAPSAEDGVYDWDIRDVLNRHILAQGVSAEEKWVDREGNTRTTTKVKIVGFKKITEEKIPF